ncbi:MAG: molecular chaperone DnaK [Candidatus Scalindua sp. AMX11]|nr:MAG: molecular chaperone DnaK [Candidatus Scalindua sp.]NOG83606.1 hsp70 family protein [Planctomycetota bacterium]RZV69642.1 MAG: molecular chaperone DnaK [Candidatus Scalindua sp. SCAELEC01]TDE64093.1 MAG: molecular chaperone DnaK [Candidatus Scalindua sp. AMX11]GJQ60161.1 MAG: molecular chaperone DnaK [Candidatus Scalindua sp.]
MKEALTENALEEIPFKFVVGIDLGTTNSAVSFVDLTTTGSEKREIQFFTIPQLVAPGELGERSVLPSFLYLPTEYEMKDGGMALPWDDKRGYAVGEVAREQGALVPGRLVSSAKSWLCHGGVDRTANILPWGEGSEVAKVSPLEASTRYLLHIREAWNNGVAKGREEYNLEAQLVVITVPASFDEVARELTVTAAQKAGFHRIKLMEEPLASFYAWLCQEREGLQKRMKPGQLILVCDVGGGTTDFTIISVVDGTDGLSFNRLSVGDHLMLGGDNMDLTIGRHIEMKMFGQPGKLDSKRWHQLTHQCRKAKELLLSENREKQETDITIMGTGGKLIADTLKCTIQRNSVEELIIDGFFPFVELEDVQKESKRKGLTEWGLPYVQNPAVTQHLATFWLNCKSLLQSETGREVPYPDYLLFNGGSLTPSVIRMRIQSVVKKWFPDIPDPDWVPEELPNATPELAVAIGAANYGLSKLFKGPRVGAGSPRTYFVEIASSDDERESHTRSAVCIVPRSAEEGLESELHEPAFEVLANKPVAFNVFSSSTRLGDKVGDIVTLSDDEITVLPPIHTVLRYGKKSDAKPIPVLLSVYLTEIGTLELWCNSQNSPHRWQLQFDVRLGESQHELSSASSETLDAGTIELATEKIHDVFDKERGADPDNLVKELVSVLELNKVKWSTSTIRKIADALLKCKQGRSLSPQHETRWLNLLGFCLRPGFGDPLDEWRIKETWKLFHEGVLFSKKQQNLTEWWILWRRIAGGLIAGQQLEIYKQLSPFLQSTSSKRGKGSKTQKRKVFLQKDHEVWMTLASLERLPVEIKEELGNQMLRTFKRNSPGQKELWALSRFGNRVPFHGTLDKVIPAQEAASWVRTLLSFNFGVSDTLAHTLVQLGRYTGDRERDLPDTEKDNLTKWFDSIPNGEYFKELLNNPESAYRQKEQEWIFGETLPPGLSLK